MPPAAKASLLALALLVPNASAAANETWPIDFEASRISIVAKAWGIEPDEFVFKEFQAKIVLDDANHLAAARFDFSYLDLASGHPRRDRRILEWLEAEQHPAGSFLLESLATEDGQTYAVGQLTLHGQTHQARFAYTFHPPQAPTRIEAIARIDYREWGLPTLSILFVTINPILEIKLSIHSALPIIEQ